MLSSQETNKVYLSLGLKNYPLVLQNLQKALQQAEVPMEFLPLLKTKKEIWVRDFMPLQVGENQFVQYVYDPDYLKGYKGYIPDYAEIDRILKLPVIPTDLILDGGNIIPAGDKVILTDKILRENPKYSRDGLLSELHRLTGAEPVLIPWDEAEIFGHADGMVRYIGENRVLLNCYADFDPELRGRILQALTPYFQVEELHFGHRKFKYNWGYINFLQVGKNIFVPAFGIEEDDTMLAQLKRAFPDCHCWQIKGCETLAQDGGVLNCVSWNVKQRMEPLAFESLHQALKEFNGTPKDKSLEEKLDYLDEAFSKIARQIILGGYIQVNERRIYIADVEFYYHEEGDLVKDPEMYHTSLRTGNPDLEYIDLGKFFTHLGLDVTFEKPERYRASVLLRGFYKVEDFQCPYGKGQDYDTRYSYLYEAMLKDMSIFVGIQIRWIDEVVKPPFCTIISEPRKNIKPVPGDPEGKERNWRFRVL